MKINKKSVDITAFSLLLCFIMGAVTLLHAQEKSASCIFQKQPADFVQEEIDELYECIKDDLYAVFPACQL